MPIAVNLSVGQFNRSLTRNVHDALVKHIDELRRVKPDKLIRRRREKYLKMGQFNG